MGREFLKTALGFLICVAGFYIAYLGIKQLENDSFPILLGLSLPVLVVGAFLLIRAGKTDDAVIKKPKIEVESPQDKAGLAEVLKKNNNLTTEYAKTVEKRDRLRLLEISSSAEESTND